MAHFRQRGTLWGAEVYRRGIRKRAEFATLEEAKQWSSESERAILAQFFGGRDSAITLDPREFTQLHARVKERAKQRGIAFHLTRDDLVALYARSYGMCQVTGITFNRFRPEGSTKRPWYPSIDRINSRKTYVLENCRFVCVAANIALGEWGEWVFRAMAESMILGAAGNLKPGQEAPPYKFKPLGQNPTYRQLVRRKIRRKAPPLTHGNGAS
jgi:hypothetical protein